MFPKQTWEAANTKEGRLQASMHKQDTQWHLWSLRSQGSPEDKPNNLLSMIKAMQSEKEGVDWRGGGKGSERVAVVKFGKVGGGGRAVLSSSAWSPVGEFTCKY